MAAPLVIGIIPARYGSTRFEGKPLIDLAGKSMVQRVYEQCAQAQGLAGVWVATDDERIAQHLEEKGIPYVLTGTEHPSGTDRCHEAYSRLADLGHKADFVINIQGDEPFIAPSTIEALVHLCLEPGTELATLVKPLTHAEDLTSANTAKVVLNTKGEALYFSRQPIPYQRAVPDVHDWLAHHDYYKHIGIYAYRTDVLAEITRLAVGKLEKAESLEQLRWLEHGYRIKTAVTTDDSHGIDTPEDVGRVLARFGLA